MLGVILLGSMIFFGVSLLVAAIFDHFLFYYKKRPGRGYAQIAKPGVPQWLVGLVSNLEIIALSGFILVVLVMAWLLK